MLNIVQKSSYFSNSTLKVKLILYRLITCKVRYFKPLFVIFDDYFLQLLKHFHNIAILNLGFSQAACIIIKIITNKSLKYPTLDAMSLYNILVSCFKLNY